MAPDNPNTPRRPVFFAGSNDPTEFSVRFDSKELGVLVSLGEAHARLALLGFLQSVPKPRRLAFLDDIRLSVEDMVD